MLGTLEAKPNAKTRLLPWIGCLISVYAPLPQLPLFNCLLTHLFWNLLSSVTSSTGLRLTLPRQIGEILVVCKGQREPVAMQGVEEGLGEGKWVDWALK